MIRNHHEKSDSSSFSGKVSTDVVTLKVAIFNISLLVADLFYYTEKELLLNLTWESIKNVAYSFFLSFSLNRQI